MKVRFKKMDPRAVTPTKAHPSDAGFDLTAMSRKLNGHGAWVYGTGIAVEIPAGHVGLLFPRSSIVKKGMSLTNCVGVVDSGYRGEVMAAFKPAGEYPPGVKGRGLPAPLYEIGERILQIVVMPYPEVEFEESDELSVSDRGDGGFGSTGA